MTPRTAIGALVGGFGVVVGLVGSAAVAAAVLVALGLPAVGSRYSFAARSRC